MQPEGSLLKVFMCDDDEYGEERRDSSEVYDCQELSRRSNLEDSPDVSNDETRRRRLSCGGRPCDQIHNLSIECQLVHTQSLRVLREYVYNYTRMMCSLPTLPTVATTVHHDRTARNERRRS